MLCGAVSLGSTELSVQTSELTPAPNHPLYLSAFPALPAPLDDCSLCYWLRLLEGSGWLILFMLQPQCLQQGLTHSRHSINKSTSE